MGSDCSGINGHGKMKMLKNSAVFEG